MPLSSASWMVAILSVSSFAGFPQTDDMRIQPSPSLETNGPFSPSAIFAIVVIPVVYNAKISGCSSLLISLMAQFTCLGGSNYKSLQTAGFKGSCCFELFFLTKDHSCLFLPDLRRYCTFITGEYN